MKDKTKQAMKILALRNLKELEADLKKTKKPVRKSDYEIVNLVNTIRKKNFNSQKKD